MTTEIEKVAAICEGCHKPFLAARCRSPLAPTTVLLTQRRCNTCCEETARVRESQELRHAERERLRRLRESWERLCPVEFRTLDEGGRTDLDRLMASTPQAAEIANHPQSGPGMVIRGQSGTGKTRSVWRFLRTAHEAGRSIRALTSGEFDRQARDAAGTFTLTAWVDELVTADVLFLDDIGKAPWSPSTIGLWFEVLDGRYRHGRQTVLTSNLSGEALAKQLRIAKDIAEPMLRRLRETCDVVVCRVS